MIRFASPMGDPSPGEAIYIMVRERISGVIAVLDVYPVPIALILMAALVAGVTDVWKFKVYNLLTFPLAASGLLYHAINGGAPRWRAASSAPWSGSPS